MNERIKKLEIQAADGTIDPNEPFTAEEFYNFTEKFAELLVRECCSVVKPSTEYPTESVDIVEEFHRGYWVGCNDSTMRIEDHFGD